MLKMGQCIQQFVYLPLSDGCTFPCDAVIWCYRTIAKYVAPKVGEDPVKSYEMYTSFWDLASTVSWEDLLEHKGVVCGAPDIAVVNGDISDPFGPDQLQIDAFFRYNSEPATFLQWSCQACSSISVNG